MMIKNLMLTVLFFLGMGLLSPRIAYAVTSGVVTIQDYPRYGTNPSPTQIAELRPFAAALVGALIVGAQVDISIYGYADFDAKGFEFETEVSQQRAQAAKATLAGLIREEAAKVNLAEARVNALTYS